MQDLKTKAKLSVLQDLIETMKESENSQFKSKSSKFMPKPEQEMSEEMPEMDEEMIPEEMEEKEELFPDEDKEDEDDLERLKELYSRLK